MKHLDEYRSPEWVETLLGEIHRTVSKPWRIMEVCGGQTHSIIRHGIDTLLPDSITLIHGPGCPVCVTPIHIIDQALELAERKEVLFCTFGDMMRVPGTSRDLLTVKAAGGDVRMVYSPLKAVEIAKQNPDREIVFFSVGFETTAPATAMAVPQAARAGLKNFSLLVAHVLVPPALKALMGSVDCRINGFLAAGHVCTVMGIREYEPICQEYKVPIVVTGFEPVDLIRGILSCVKQLESGSHQLENQYSRWVKEDGNPSALKIIRQVFQTVDRDWRGMGTIPSSGFALREAYEAFDAVKKFGLDPNKTESISKCRSGDVLKGLIRPDECPAFGKECLPQHPLGAPMVSSEGACSAYYKYRLLGNPSPNNQSQQTVSSSKGAP